MARALILRMKIEFFIVPIGDMIGSESSRTGETARMPWQLCGCPDMTTQPMHDLGVITSGSRSGNHASRSISPRQQIQSVPTIQSLTGCGKNPERPRIL
jgi:hypothetical protein